MGTLLVAGPVALDDHPRQNGLLGGVGLYAAIAAAPLAKTQLWARAGNSINNQLKAIIARRGIDLSTHRAAQVTADDLAAFDHVFVMDKANLGDVLTLDVDDAHGHKVRLVSGVSGKGVTELLREAYNMVRTRKAEIAEEQAEQSGGAGWTP